MRSKLLIAGLLTAAIPPAVSHNPITTKLTWARDISRIVYKRCASCHREGGRAPMSLLTYEDARPWAKAIQEEVLERRMPPWGAVKGFGEFQNDLSLTQEELHVISDWVDGGAPEGDPKYLPDRPSFHDPTPQRLAGAVTVRGSLRLDRAGKLIALAPHKVAEGASLRVFATLPDLRIEPLLWIYNFQPKFQRSYRYRDPVTLPAGSTIVVVPAQAGSVLVVMR